MLTTNGRQWPTGQAVISTAVVLVGGVLMAQQIEIASPAHENTLTSPVVVDGITDLDTAFIAQLGSACVIFYDDPAVDDFVEGYAGGDDFTLENYQWQQNELLPVVDSEGDWGVTAGIHSATVPVVVLESDSHGGETGSPGAAM